MTSLDEMAGREAWRALLMEHFSGNNLSNMDLNASLIIIRAWKDLNVKMKRQKSGETMPLDRGLS